MVSPLSQFTSALCSLPYPMPESVLEQKLAKMQRSLLRNIPPSEVSALLSVLDDARTVNLTFLSALLRESSTALLRQIVANQSFDLTVGALKRLKHELEVAILKVAAGYVDLTMENAPKLKIDEIVTREVAEHVVAQGEAATALLTQPVIEKIYRNCEPELDGKTQFQIISLGCTGLLRPHIDSCFSQLLDVHRLPQSFERKLLKKLTKQHFLSLIPIVKKTFHAELKSVVPGKCADWDIDPGSIKASHLQLVASVANSLQPNEGFSQQALGRVLTWSRYPTVREFTVNWQPLLEGVCRLYIGLLGIGQGMEQGEIETDPEIYLWMRRVMRKLYEYPRETDYFENRFLNVMNECVARWLKQRSAFHQNLRYCLQQAQCVPNSRQDPKFMKLIYDSVEFRYLSDFPSISSMLHISGAKGSSVLDEWPLATGLHLSKDVLQWRSPPRSNSPSACGLMAVPLTMLTGWFLAIPMLLKTVVDVAVNCVETAKRKVRKAVSVGVFLGLLLVHRQIRNRFQSLLGYCFGAQIVLACLAEVAEYNRRSPKEKRVYLNDVILLLGAVDAEDVDWELVTEPVRGRFINLYYPRDDYFSSALILSMRQPIGSRGIHRSGIEDVDITDAIEAELNCFQRTAKAPNAFKKIAKLISYCP